ncbi:MAG: alpha/beta hydrolase [Acidobacteria bacterium]|nr:alpha/beta hydrolase [Acidobacteriota bacterium]
MSTYRVKTLSMTDHWLTVPLNHAEPDGEHIAVFAREMVAAKFTPHEVAALPWLLYLQGGPGGRGMRPVDDSGWLKEATKTFRVLMLDQRGTGLSTPANRQTLAERGTPFEQADYLAHFRADSIVADAEAFRGYLGAEQWSILGQSFGGFCALTYLSVAPQSLREVLMTGGLGPLTGHPDRVYQATFMRLAARNAEYFERYPQDRSLLTEVVRHLASTEEFLATGERLSPERFLLVGNYLGGNVRIDGLHYLLEDAFIVVDGQRRLSDTFLHQVNEQVTRASNPLYAVLHESIYCQGEASNWSAQRVLEQFADFKPNAPEPLLTGEMVYPWYFEQDPALKPLAATAQALAERTDWPALYDLDVLAHNTVPVAAAVYTDDIYVDRDIALETAGRVRGLQVWETADFHHDGLADDGEAIFARLLSMVRAVRA